MNKCLFFEMFLLRLHVSLLLKSIVEVQWEPYLMFLDANNNNSIHFSGRNKNAKNNNDVSRIMKIEKFRFRLSIKLYFIIIRIKIS
jgi:hypothetical protein